MSNIYITKSDGTEELFKKEKLEDSLKRAGARGAEIKEILEHLGRELVSGMSTSDIYKHAFALLQKFESPAAAKYSLKRAVMELGPSGFPFEKFVAEILKDKGYKTETNLMLRGSCIEHEIDVLAINKNKFVIIEAKFHNDQGIKTDSKVPLYVNSRIEDLRKSNFDGRKPNNLKDEPWIITNTKFSGSAKAYGKCIGIKMIDWNSPRGESLRELIEDSGLHPLTCLTTLSKKEKGELLLKGVSISKHLTDNIELLRSIGINSARISKVINEINNLKR